MKERCIVDTTVLAKILIQKNDDLLNNLVKDYRLYTPMNVMEEVFFQVLVSVVGGSSKDYRFYDVKRDWLKGVGKKEVCETINSLVSLTDLGVLSPLELNVEIFKSSIALAKKYSLLPNDALIAATCKFYDIKKIASFDKDFKQVDFLEIVKP